MFRWIRFLAIVTSLVGMLISAQADELPKPNPPNVVLLVTDDHEHDALGCAGDPMVKTPHIDHLAAEGARFANAFCSFPVCGPARATIYTGRYPHSHGIYANDYILPDIEITLAEMLRDHGYQTAAIGKMHHPEHNHIQGYDYAYLRTEMRNTDRDKRINARIEWLGPKYFAFMVGELEGPVETTVSSWITDEALKYLDQVDSKKPFHMLVSWTRPHDPQTPPKSYADMYDPKKVVLPPNWNNRFTEALPWCPKYWPQGIQAQYTEKQLRTYLTHYYGAISVIDWNVGRIVDKLKKLGVYDNTLVCFIGDHGILAGHYSQISKGPFAYDPVIGFPWIIRLPSAIPGSQVIDGLVEQVDIVPTILDFCGIPIPGPFVIDGVSQKPLLTGERKTGKDAIFGEIRRICNYVRTEDAMLCWYQEGSELYDLREDPHETKNVFDKRRYAALQRRMMKRLMDWCVATHDLSSNPKRPR